MRILAVASEVAPWASTGGLADVVAALGPALTAADPTVQVATVVPLYRTARQALAAAGVPLVAGPRLSITVDRWPFDVQLVAAAGLHFVACDPLYDRAGLYGDDGRDHADNDVRFAVLCRAALAAGPTLLGGPIDVVHAHDWQGALAVVYAREAGLAAATITTIHNLAYRGIFPKAQVPALGLPWSVFTHRRAEFWDQLSLLKAGLADADVVTTVSPTYAREILTPGRGEGLDQFLRHDVRALHGITNGVDTDAWDPATDPALPAHFARADLAGKARCRQALAAALGLTIDATTPIAATVARLTPQKGIDLIAAEAGPLVAAGARLAILGSGDRDLEDHLAWLARAHPGAIAVRLGFDPALARLLYAGADLFLMPSRFEPCGLGQQYAMRYGAVPVVAAVGGLVDTVVDAASPDGTGFCFEVVDGAGLVWAVERAVAMFRTEPARFAAMIDRGMARDASWAVPARAYLALYAAALRRRSP